MDEFKSLPAIRKESLFRLSLFIILSFWISMLILSSKKFLLIFSKSIVLMISLWTLLRFERLFWPLILLALVYTA